MKRIILMLIAIFAIGLLAACGQNNNEENNNNVSESANENGNTDVSGDEYEFKLSTMFPDDHPNTISAKNFVEKVEERSDGRIKIKLYPANQLGDPTVVYQEIGKGTIDMSLMSAPSNFDERLEFLYLPYLVTSFDELESVYGLDSFVFETTHDIHSKQNIKLLGFHGEGFGGVGTTRALDDPGSMDDKNMMIRIPQMDLFKKFSESLGFRTVSIPFSDLYMALQTGQAEGWIGGQPASNYTDFKDVLTHYYQYNNFFEMQSLIINQDIWDDLSEEDQEILQTAGVEMTTESFADAEKYDEEFREKLADYGIEVILLEEEKIDNIAKKTREELWPQFTESLTEEIIDGLLESIE